MGLQVEDMHMILVIAYDCSIFGLWFCVQKGVCQIESIDVLEKKSAESSFNAKTAKQIIVQWKWKKKN